MNILRKNKNLAHILSQFQTLHDDLTVFVDETNDEIVSLETKLKELNTDLTRAQRVHSKINDIIS